MRSEPAQNGASSLEAGSSSSDVPSDQRTIPQTVAPISIHLTSTTFPTGTASGHQQSQPL
jgi:hypothetical protein